MRPVQKIIRKYKENKSIFGMFKNKIVSLKTLTLLSKFNLKLFNNCQYNSFYLFFFFYNI